MKSLKTKIPAIIGVIIHILVAISFVTMLILVHSESSPIDQGEGLAWVTLDWLLFMVSGFLYIIDAILSTIKSFMRIDTVFNAILSLTVLCFLVTYCLYMYVDNGYMVPLIVWILFYYAIIVLEIISVIRHIKARKAERQTVSV